MTSTELPTSEPYDWLCPNCQNDPEDCFCGLDENCSAVSPIHGTTCIFVEGHPGYHFDADTHGWVGGPMNRDGSRPEASQ